ncbi:pilus assembly protein [Catenulispora sp. NL8]|uniref:Pilus assembly protein n=1 Tax=Catenulispora pinistramenti TaxID=2705254 RepID=A0ABS5KHL6_9ACTN|nr:pilus assembly protein [Catenulispora pinistramenti]
MINMPVLVLAIMLIVQGGAYFHAQQIAQLVADRAVAAARSYEGSSQFGQSEAEHVLHLVGDGTLTNAQVQVGRGGRAVTVTVAADVPHFLPYFPSRVIVASSGPTEQYSQADRHG